MITNEKVIEKNLKELKKFLRKRSFHPTDIQSDVTRYLYEISPFPEADINRVCALCVLVFHKTNFVTFSIIFKGLNEEVTNSNIMKRFNSINSCELGLIKPAITTMVIYSGEIQHIEYMQEVFHALFDPFLNKEIVSMKDFISRQVTQDENTALSPQQLDSMEIISLTDAFNMMYERAKNEIKRIDQMKGKIIPFRRK